MSARPFSDGPLDVTDVWNRAGSRHGGARLYPMVNVRDIESGKVRATRELMGAD